MNDLETVSQSSRQPLMPYRAQGLWLSSRSFTRPDTPLFRLGQMFDMLSPVGLPQLTLLSRIHTHTCS